MANISMWIFAKDNIFALARENCKLEDHDWSRSNASSSKRHIESVAGVKLFPTKWTIAKDKTRYLMKFTYVNFLFARAHLIGGEISVAYTFSKRCATWAVVAPSPAPRSTKECQGPVKPLASISFWNCSLENTCMEPRPRSLQYDMKNISLSSKIWNNLYI